MSNPIVEGMLDDIVSALTGFEVVTRARTYLILRCDADDYEYVVVVTPPLRLDPDPQEKPASPEGQDT